MSDDKEQAGAVAKTNVISMADYADNGFMSTPVQTLEAVLAMVNDPECPRWHKQRRVLVLGFDDTGPDYDMPFIQCGFRYPEILLLLEYFKLRMMKEAGLL
jgi:hypothetical protein